jgi:hypothetical protein
MRLEAVFWDYPKFLDERYLRSFLQESGDSEMIAWIMARFLEHGRVVDTLSLFDLNDIVASLPSLKISGYAQHKWRRLIEVYASSQRT